MSRDAYPSEEELARMEERARRATPGPWAYKERLGGGDCFVFSEETFHVVAAGGGGEESGFRTLLGPEDADFVAAAREDVPRLLAEVRRLRAAQAPRVLGTADAAA